MGAPDIPGMMCYWIFGIEIPCLTAYGKTNKNNCRKIREVINTYIQKRKSGEIKSQVKNGTDLLSVFLKSPEIFRDDDIIDELMDFFLAGT